MVDIPTPPQQDKPMSGPLPPVGGGSGAPAAPQSPAVTPPPVPAGQPAPDVAPPNIPATSAAPESPAATRGQINPALGTEPKVPGMPDNAKPTSGATFAQAVSSPATPPPSAFIPKTPDMPGGIPGAGPMPPAPPAMSPQKKKGRMWLWLTIIIIVILVAAGVVYFFFFRTPSTTTTTDTPSLTDEQTTEPETPDADSDADGDGLTYAQEQLLGSNPDLDDTDGDGYKDGEEFANGYSPTAGNAKLDQTVIDQVNALAPSTSTSDFEVIGETLVTVYSGTGSYRCTVTGTNGDGTSNIVTLNIKDGKYRGEFVHVVDGRDIKLAYIVDGQKIYFGNVDNNKFVELIYDPITGVGASEDINGNGVPEFKVSGFIFTSEALLTQANPTKIECSAAVVADADFTVTADQLIEINEAAANDIQSSN
ncbi:hypothetical protein ACFL1U_01650 [Patescibacteria group bacterium]